MPATLPRTSSCPNWSTHRSTTAAAGLRGAQVGRVGHDEPGPSLHGTGEPGLVDVDREDRRALGCEPISDRTSHARTGAGHERDPPFESFREDHHVCAPGIVCSNDSQ